MDVIWPCIIRAGLAEPEIFFTKNYVMVGTPRRNPASEPRVGTPRLASRRAGSEPRGVVYIDPMTLRPTERSRLKNPR